ncbi:hypothetical protein BDZ85DRAFT_261108 [Elsinoe ampelina]|uniref:Uncharacterized protein n=1 Tax=Elsinoe ampelina TaxID=302913 RepID=A0A6A6GFS1_9PEZI|nr:hypothetical protein BDZ85DRAFT_261108 [Elsinoe ampelina]
MHAIPHDIDRFCHKAIPQRHLHAGTKGMKDGRSILPRGNFSGPRQSFPAPCVDSPWFPKHLRWCSFGVNPPGRRRSSLISAGLTSSCTILLLPRRGRVVCCSFRIENEPRGLGRGILCVELQYCAWHSCDTTC